MTSDTPAIRLAGLRKAFGVVEAVAGIDLEIADGEFFSMLGPSGSGKTTVLRLIAGFEQPTAGTIALSGRDVTRLAPFERDVNTVFQDYALFPHMSVRQNVEYGLKVRKVARRSRRDRAEQALATVRLEGYGERKPSELSGGQRQRVAIARALAVGPKVVLADEPTSMLDVSIRIGILNLMLSLREEFGITFLYVTHDLASARYVADDILVMYAGQIVESGPVEQVLSTPLHPYTRLLLASAPDPATNLHAERIEVRKGVASAAVDPPEGCRFVTRCPLAIDVCSRVTPPLVEARPEQAARCHVTAPST
jgi:oligopeptide/dipeptide ABC transporter ATP-binding protein